MQVRGVGVAIIGAGTAGMTAYRIAREHTDNLLVIESSHYGTTCARVGCMPSKLLIAAAEVNHQIGEPENSALMLARRLSMARGLWRESKLSAIGLLVS